MRNHSQPEDAPASDLTALFAEARSDELRRQVAADKAHFLNPDTAVCLFGAGNTGREMAAFLKQENIAVAAFVDDTPAKQGAAIDGIPVLSRARSLAEFGSRAAVIVTIYRPGHSYLKTRRALKELGFGSVYSFTHVVRAFPEICAPYKCFHAPEAYLPFEATLQSITLRLADAESRAEYERQMRFRMLLDYECIRPSPGPIYFDASVLPPLPPQGYDFVDCGAYDGDTIRQFLSWCAGRYRSVLALEPDPGNYRKLEEALRNLPLEQRETIRCANSAVGEKTGEAFFDASGTMASLLSERGTQRVRVTALDELLSAPGSYFVKFDVEGGEREALKGLVKTIHRQPPVLAVSAYHLFDDLWVLPHYLWSVLPDYKLYLRAYDQEAMDCVLYAVP